MISISTVDELKAISNNLSGDYELVNDIDLSSVEKWSPIGKAGDLNTAFTGTLNGNGHKIKNMTITINSSYDRNLVGFFRVLGNCTIQNLAFENVTINSTGYNNCIGVLAGAVYYSAPTITKVSVQGTMNVIHNYTSSTYAFRGIGGFVGSCYGDSTYMIFTDCISKVNINITGSSRSLYVGGFIGYLRYVKLYRCFAFGTITVLGQETQYLLIGGFCPHQYSALNNACASAVSIVGANSNNSSACCKYLSEISSFTSTNSRRVWNGATFSYETYVSTSDILFDEDDVWGLIGSDNLETYIVDHNMDFSDLNKCLKLNFPSEISYNIEIDGVTYKGVKKIIYNKQNVTKLIIGDNEYQF